MRINREESTAKRKTKHARAYCCFFPLAALSLVLVLLLSVSVGKQLFATVALLVLAPLAVAAVVTTPMGMFYTLFIRRDTALHFISFLSVVQILELFVALLAPGLHILTGSVYSFLVTAFSVYWFTSGYKYFYP